MEPLVLFVLQFLWFLFAWSLITYFVVWPWTARLTPSARLSAFVAPQMFRVLGVGLLVPNLSPGMPAGFATSTAAGDARRFHRSDLAHGGSVVRPCLRRPDSRHLPRRELRPARSRPQVVVAMQRLCLSVVSALAIVSLLHASAASAQVNHPADESKPVAWYVDLGAPSPDRSWAPDDYEQLVTVLAPLGQRSPTELPRLRSPLSGALFRRCIDPSNFVEMLGSAPPTMRLPTMLGYIGASQKLFVMYLELGQRGVVFDDELVGLMGFLLALGESAAHEGDALMAATPADDPRRAKREAGLDQVRAGLANMVSGAVGTVGERTVYRPAARADLIASLRKYLPKLFPYLSELQRRETSIALEKLAAAEQDAELAKALRDLRAELG